RFSPSTTRRDWTDESLARLRQFYAAYTTTEGRLPLEPYLKATVRHREALTAGKITLGEVAAKEKLNEQYLVVLWQALTDKKPSLPLDLIRNRWREASEKNLGALLAEITAWQKELWQLGRIGSYVRGPRTRPVPSMSRQTATDPEEGDPPRLQGREEFR